MSKAISELWLENRRGVTAIGIGESSPRLSWTLEADARQASVEVELIHGDGATERHVEPTRSSRLLDWPFAPLRSRQSVSVRARITSDGEREPSDWSEPLIIEAGLLNQSDWTVPFSSPSPEAPHGVLRPGYLLRAEYDLAEFGVGRSRIRRARIYSSAHGVYSLEFNGRPLSEDLLSPGWTSYLHRLRLTSRQ